MSAVNASAAGQKVSIIIPARNDSKTIAQVIRQAMLVKPESEIIVVCDGSTDQTADIAAAAGAGKVLTCHETLGHGVGRSVGAKYAIGDILLFLDADVAILSHQLQRFIGNIENGWDVILNNHFAVSPRHEESLTKHLLNHMLGRPELKYSSMAAAPFALSKYALNVIGIDQLCVPPVAHARAILQGLKVTVCDSVNMREVYKKSARKTYKRKQMLGDHAEAIACVVAHRGERGGMTDFDRCRHLLTFDP